jgi:hypothetical protein
MPNIYGTLRGNLGIPPSGYVISGLFSGNSRNHSIAIETGEKSILNNSHSVRLYY